MPIPLTRKELEYLLKLVWRNARLFMEMHDSGAIDESKLSEGLQKPMPAWERKLRQRIRSKARILSHLLGLISFAGVYPDRKRRIGERPQDIIDAWWVMMPQLTKELEPETLDKMYELAEKTGLTTKKAAEEVAQILCLIVERVQRS